MNLLTILALLILAVCAIGGLARGFVKTVFTLVGLVAAIAAAVFLSPHLSSYLAETSLYDDIETQVEKAVDDTGSSQEGLTMGDAARIFALPSMLSSELQSSSEGYPEGGLTAYTVTYVTGKIIDVIAFIIVLAAVWIIIALIAHALDHLARKPVLNALNRFGGLAIGLLKGMLILWIFCLLIMLAVSFNIGNDLYAQIQESTFLSWVYDNNLLLTLLGGLIGA
ncbi:MAG: CvpA family protein [Lachnospiraceae bacterium]|jgi:uncharacterized membrane protein required for colicin V production